MQGLPGAGQKLNKQFRCNGFFDFLDSPKYHCPAEDPQDIYDSIPDDTKLKFLQSYIRQYRPADCYFGLIYILVGPDDAWAKVVPYPLDAAANAGNVFSSAKCERAKFSVIDVTQVQTNQVQPPTDEWLKQNWQQIIPVYSIGLHGSVIFIDNVRKTLEFFDPDRSGIPAPIIDAVYAYGKFDYKYALQPVCPRIQGKTGDEFCQMWSFFYIIFRLRCPTAHFSDLVRYFPQPQQLLTLLQYFMCFVRAYLIEHRLWMFSFAPTLSRRTN